MKYLKRIPLFFLVFSALHINAQVAKVGIMDELTFGNIASEQTHHFSGELSKEIKGGTWGKCKGIAA